MGVSMMDGPAMAGFGRRTGRAAPGEPETGMIWGGWRSGLHNKNPLTFSVGLSATTDQGAVAILERPDLTAAFGGVRG